MLTHHYRGRGIQPVHPMTVIEAALAQAGRLPNLERHYPAPVLEAAHRAHRGGIGLQEMLLAAARHNGYHSRGRVGDNLAPMLRAAFSTSSLAGVLSNNANKFLLEGFNAVETTWRMVAARRTANDFKPTTSVRLGGDYSFDKVGAAGQLKHAVPSEQTFTNKADTYGRMFGVSRQDIVNDDLGALTDTPTKVGRGAGLKLNDVFWREFLDNSAFFTSGRGNLLSGGGSALSASSLATAEQAFLNQTDPDGKPIAVNPGPLLVPPPLKRTAMELMASSNFVAGGGASGGQIPSANTWQGAYPVGVAPYLSNASYPGYSATAWYLCADPASLPVIEVVFLNGVEQPTVESAEADFNTLGIQFRGYFDFGVAKQDYRGGVRSDGA